MKGLKGVLWTTGAMVVLAAVGFWMRPLDFFENYTYLNGALHGVQNRWAWVDGRRMHYEVEGPANGAPVVLVHGLGGSADDWRALAPYLAKAGFRVYMPDLIGYGRSEQPANFSYSIRDEAALVAGFLDVAGLKRVDLGGWSMGGWIVQMVAYRHPDRIKRLMLFDSAGLYEMPKWNTSLFTPTSASQLDQLNALLAPNPPHIPGFVAADFLRVSKETGWVVRRAMAQMLTGRDATDNLLPQLKMPVLIEWGAEDRIVPPDQAEKIHSLVHNSELQLYAGCGHLAPLQCTKEMGPNVVRYLRQTPAGPAAAPPGPAKPPPSTRLHARTVPANLDASRAGSVRATHN